MSMEPGYYRAEYTVKLFRIVEVRQEDIDDAEGDPKEAVSLALMDEGLTDDWEEAELWEIKDIQRGIE